MGYFLRLACEWLTMAPLPPFLPRKLLAASETIRACLRTGIRTGHRLSGARHHTGLLRAAEPGMWGPPHRGLVQRAPLPASSPRLPPTPASRHRHQGHLLPCTKFPLPHEVSSLRHRGVWEEQALRRCLQSEGRGKGTDGRGDEEVGGEDTATLTPAKGPQLLALEKTKSILMISVAQRTTTGPSYKVGGQG